MSKILHVSVHAEERFMQRVFNTPLPSTNQLKLAGRLISIEVGTNELIDGVYPLPSFEGFKFIIKDNTVVTIRKEN